MSFSCSVSLFSLKIHSVSWPLGTGFGHKNERNLVPINYFIFSKSYFTCMITEYLVNNLLAVITGLVTRHPACLFNVFVFVP